MSFWESILRILDTQMQTPASYGWFHLLFWGLSILWTVYLCIYRKNDSPQQIRSVILLTAIVVIVLEIYKQINYSFSYESGVSFDYQWYAFPWQFCSTPMYVGLLAGLVRKSKIHDAACAFLATYAIFAGLAVMVYPGDVFTGTVGINIQTMICHGSMLPIGAYLYATGHVKLEHKTILKALPVFAVALLAAVVMNEIAYQSGLLQTESFNMFYVSPHCDPHLPVYSLVQQVLPFPWCLVVYILGFTAAAYIMLLGAMGIRKLFTKKKKSTLTASHV